jgi:hypothetical protein
MARRRGFFVAGGMIFALGMVAGASGRCCLPPPRPRSNPHSPRHRPTRRSPVVSILD